MLDCKCLSGVEIGGANPAIDRNVEANFRGKRRNAGNTDRNGAGIKPARF
ncbi:MAG: hypothetical protein JW963_16670 [Anaerolineales bacterium]|nr:hypothetical protein [Anaerolineales bacterium]